MSDPIERQDAIDVVSYSIELCNKALDSITLGGRDRYAVEVERNSLLKLKDDIKLLPSVQPEIKPIEYRDCANAMLKMWIDKVLTDGEYNRIMDKLNAHWKERREE